MVQKALDYIMDRLREPSTWRGLIMVIMSVLSMFGKKYELTADQILTIITIGIFIVGLVGSVLPDKLKASGKTVAEAITDTVQDVAKKEAEINADSKAIHSSDVYHPSVK
jgi:hypothetical protein